MPGNVLSTKNINIAVWKRERNACSSGTYNVMNEWKEIICSLIKYIVLYLMKQFIYNKMLYIILNNMLQHYMLIIAGK